MLRVEDIADREALVIDWYSNGESSENGSGEDTEVWRHRGRYWVDSVTGVILRRQRFSAIEVDQLVDDTWIYKIEFNFDIPHRLYDRSQPSQTYFAQDHRGDPELNSDEGFWEPPPVRTSIPRIPAPDSYDPSQGRLTFQWTSLAEFDPGEGTHVDIFADGYFLGNIEFADPDQIICARSQDGTKIAFTGWNDNTNFGYDPLRWFSLTDLSKINKTLDEFVPYDFAFSPDNKQLAVYGCHRHEEGESCGIFLHDTETDESKWLTEVERGGVERGGGLVWSPDKKFLAVQGGFMGRWRWRLLVFDVQSGEKIYDEPFDLQGFWVSPDSPIHEWGVSYPPDREGLDTCSEPPEGG
ncbi:hypothetical protein ES703_121233 [subsurface metagenome]